MLDADITISVFGNPDLPLDSIPLRLIPDLQKRFPSIRFFVEDPNEIDLPKHGKWAIIDTVRGLDRVGWISIDDITRSRNVGTTAHDYDLSTLLLLAKKLDSSFEPSILGVPEGMPEHQALSEIIRELSRIL